MKKHTKIVIIPLILVAVGVATFGYFAVAKKIFVSRSKNISVTQLASEGGQQSAQSDSAAQEAVGPENQDLAQQDAEAVAVPSGAPQSTAESKISPNLQEKTNRQDVGENAKNNIQDKKTSSSRSSTGKIVGRFVSWGFTKSSARTIDTIIVHSSYDALGDDPYSVDGVIAEWKAAGVAPHYLIARDGNIYQLVADNNIAWHAGVSKMPDGRTNVNDFSIGVEMINTKDGKYTDEQYSALNSLIASLKKKYPIKNILGHDEIAPDRKTDPWGMEWNKVNR